MVQQLLDQKANGAQPVAADFDSRDIRFRSTRIRARETA